MAGVEVIILAAGQGKRMVSAWPKVLHALGGKPLLGHVIAVARALRPSALHVVYGHGGEAVRACFAKAALCGDDLCGNDTPGVPIRWVHQTEQRGTGHAVREALPGVRSDDTSVVVLNGDVPLVSPATLLEAVAAAAEGALTVVTAEVRDATGYGRILRDGSGRMIGIREEKDASDEERRINEINSGIMVGRCGHLRRWLAALQPNNEQGELYLTDAIEAAISDKVPVATVLSPDEAEIAGVNDRVQLAQLERVYQLRKAQELMYRGATIADPARIDIRGNVNVGQDVFIDVNVVFEGDVEIGAGSTIGPNCLIKQSSIGPAVEVLANSIIESAVVAARARVGPFARVRPESVLEEGVHVGNFVEVKKSTLARGSKVNHLSYVGDAQVGARVNIGAGTITCNYDGAKKHRTIIEDDAFIGSGTELVAPITVGAHATIGAGSTLSRDAPQNALTVNRAPVRSVSDWQRPKK
ncbi:MAG: UDP-N-acetylglucosamine diphosphorylase/glucosamine-1-phosphate N-acetyltransferase [Gammaproteobacteria bacterium]|nr:UDP-N-acetylglucosamine diphosphorylase/glucosamine-1-phosphate N-acetyltransferase [Gammaproteobacteria bacterium]